MNAEKEYMFAGLTKSRYESRIVARKEAVDMKIIIYALGRIYEEQKNRIDWSQVSALADKSVQPGMKINGLPVVSPDMIGHMQYDYISVFSTRLYEEIRRELIGKYSVPRDKIIPWTELVIGEKEFPLQALETYSSFFETNACERILDVGMSVLSNHYLLKTQFLTDEKMILDGLKGNEAVMNHCLYDNTYVTCEECLGCYDVVLLWGDLNGIETQLRIFRNRRVQTRYILLHTGYLCKDKPVRENLCRLLQKYGKVSFISGFWGIVWIIDTQYRKKCEDMHIFVAMHKKYNVQSNELYIPLCAGKFQMHEYMTEQKGDNISYLNAKINECTLLYWIWKNTNSKYVGLNHYRRYFYNNEIKSMDNYLDMPHASDILREYDIILTKVQSMGYTTVYEQIYNSIDHDLCEKGYCLIRNGIKKRQPDYLQAFEDVMKGHTTFLCNMFVTRREILDRYCEWLFSFLIEAAEKIDIDGYDSYSQRVIGFFAERMWTVWLRRNKLKIKELPYVIVK